jgi:hypothetical protein
MDRQVLKPFSLNLEEFERRLNRKKVPLTSAVQVGDVVYLRAAGFSLPFIALVETINSSRTAFTARWFYRWDDLPTLKLRQSCPRRKGELFLSSHRDENPMEAVVGKCDVLRDLSPDCNYGQENENTVTHFCTHGFKPGCQTLYRVPDWSHGAGKIVSSKKLNPNEQLQKLQRVPFKHRTAVQGINLGCTRCRFSRNGCSGPKGCIQKLLRAQQQNEHKVELK